MFRGSKEIMKKESVLITGGAGYLGSVITDELLKTGYSVTCYDNLMYSQKNIPPFFNNPNFDFIYGDVRDTKKLERILRHFDVIIPLAAIVGMPACEQKPGEAKAINQDSIIWLNEKRDGGQKMIYPNTNSGYGTKTGELYCTEETPLEPISLYGKTKCAAEKNLLDSEKDAITLRLATVFGSSPRMRTDLLVNDFVLRAMRDNVIIIYESHFKRNYIHVRDVARCFEHCIREFDVMKNRPYNVGLEDANISKLELAEKIKVHLPRFEIICKETEKDPDQRNYVVSSKRLIDSGFNTQFSIEDGIKELIKTYTVLLKNDQYKNL